MKKVVKGFASIVMFASMIFVVGCKPPTSTSDPSTGGSEQTGQSKITVTVAHDAGVDKVEPATLSVGKGSKWSAIKSKITVTPKTGFAHAGWKLNDASGADLTDDYPFNSDTTVFAVSKEAVTVTVAHDAGVKKVDPETLSVAKGSTWSAIKSQITVTYNDGYGEAGWKLNDASGADLTDDYPFNSDTTVFAVSEKVVTITVHGDERIDLSSPLQIVKKYDTPWSSIKAEIKGKIKPSAAWEKDWNNGDYAVYEWRFGDENGEKISDTRTFTENTTVYAVSNYVKWNIFVETLMGVESGSSKPRGKIILPDGVKVIAQSALRFCSGLTSITIPESVLEITAGAFDDCSALTDITIPSGVRSIQDNTFKDCLSLTAITIPARVTSIGESAFEGCSSLSSITIPKSVTSIGKGAFGNCKNLKTLTVDSGNEKYKSDKNIIYTKDGKTLIAVASGLTGTINIPNGVTTIGESAFEKCSSLTTVNIPTSVTSIAHCAFEYCSSLTTVNIPTSVTSIGDFAFYRCSSLTSITISKSVTKIGQQAFDGCRNLASVTFAKPRGWAVYEDKNCTNKVADIEQLYLESKSRAASLLRETYCGKYWKKN